MTALARLKRDLRVLRNELRRDPRVKFLDVRLVGMSGSTLELQTLVVKADQRGGGAGAMVMDALTCFADAHGLRMILTPSDVYGGDEGRLRAFYGRWGFVPQDEVRMGRDPVRRVNPPRGPGRGDERMRRSQRGDGDGDPKIEAWRRGFPVPPDRTSLVGVFRDHYFTWIVKGGEHLGREVKVHVWRVVDGSGRAKFEAWRRDDRPGGVPLTELLVSGGVVSGHHAGQEWRDPEMQRIVYQLYTGERPNPPSPDERLRRAEQRWLTTQDRADRDAWARELARVGQTWPDDVVMPPDQGFSPNHVSWYSVPPMGRGVSLFLGHHERHEGGRLRTPLIGWVSFQGAHDAGWISGVNQDADPHTIARRSEEGDWWASPQAQRLLRQLALAPG